VKYEIEDPTTYGERCSLAAAFIDNEKLTIPTIVDDMDNTTNQAYDAWPDRLFVIDYTGNIALAAERGPWGFKPALAATREWLAKLSDKKIESGKTQTRDSTSAK
jgi:Iodothyronine deiodinase